jgi:hypothetical protein
LVFLYESLYPINLAPGETTALLKSHGREPEFGFITLTLDMNMGRLIAVVRVKEKAI